MAWSARRRRRSGRDERADLRAGCRLRSSPAATSSTIRRARCRRRPSATISWRSGCRSPQSAPPNIPSRDSASSTATSSMSARSPRCSISTSRVMETLAAERFKGKDKLIEANQRALRIGHDEAMARFACPIGVRVRRSDAVGDRILVEGNFAAALGAVYGGATVCAWYPITPSTSVAEAFERLCSRHRVDAATERRTTPSCRPRTRSPPSGWRSARAGTARAPSPRHRGPGSR